MGRKRLERKQRVFVEEYLQCWNAAEAARRAGYSAQAARQQGYSLLQRTGVREAVRERLRERAMGADEALARLAEQARGDLGDFLVEDEKGVRFDLGEARRQGKTHLLRALTVKGTRVELHDSQAALALIGRHLGLFGERRGAEREEGQEEQRISVEEWKARMLELIAEEIEVVGGYEHEEDGTEGGDGDSTGTAVAGLPGPGGSDGG